MHCACACACMRARVRVRRGPRRPGFSRRRAPTSESQCAVRRSESVRARVCVCARASLAQGRFDSSLLRTRALLRTRGARSERSDQTCATRASPAHAPSTRPNTCHPPRARARMLTSCKPAPKVHHSRVVRKRVPRIGGSCDMGPGLMTRDSERGLEERSRRKVTSRGENEEDRREERTRREQETARREETSDSERGG